MEYRASALEQIRDSKSRAKRLNRMLHKLKKRIQKSKKPQKNLIRDLKQRLDEHIRTKAELAAYENLVLQEYLSLIQNNDTITITYIRRPRGFDSVSDYVKTRISENNQIIDKYIENSLIDEAIQQKYGCPLNQDGWGYLYDILHSYSTTQGSSFEKAYAIISDIRNNGENIFNEECNNGYFDDLRQMFEAKRKQFLTECRSNIVCDPSNSKADPKKTLLEALKTEPSKPPIPRNNSNYRGNIHSREIE